MTSPQRILLSLSLAAFGTLNAAQHPEVRAELQAILDKERSRTPIVPQQHTGG